MKVCRVKKVSVNVLERGNRWASTAAVIAIDPRRWNRKFPQLGLANPQNLRPEFQMAAKRSHFRVAIPVLNAEDGA